MPSEFVPAACACPGEDTVEVAKNVLVGKVQQEIVLALKPHGQPAVGLFGDDGIALGVGRPRRPAP